MSLSVQVVDELYFFSFCSFLLLKNDRAREVGVDRDVRMSGSLGLGDLGGDLVKLGLLLSLLKISFFKG